MLINQSNLDIFFQGLQRNFEDGLMLNPAMASLWQRVATLVISTTRKENYPMLTKGPKMRKRIGPRIVNQLSSYNYVLENARYEETLEVREDDLMDDTFGLYAPYARALGSGAAFWPTENVFTTLASGHLPTHPAYDGQNFFDTDHEYPAAGSGVYSNSTGAAAVNPWWVLDADFPIRPLIFQQRMAPTFWAITNPEDTEVRDHERYLYGAKARGAFGFGLWQTAHRSTDTLTEGNFTEIRRNMQGLQTPEGFPMNILMGKPLVVVGRSNQDAARKLFGQDRLATGESNYLLNAADVLVVPFLP